MTDNDDYMSSKSTNDDITELMWDRLQEGINANRRYRIKAVAGGNNMRYSSTKVVWDSDIYIYFTRESDGAWVYNKINANPTTGITCGNDDLLYVTLNDTTGTVLTVNAADYITMLTDDTGRVLILGAVRDSRWYGLSTTDLDHTNLLNIGSNSHATIDTHLGSTANPHSVEWSDVSSGHNGAAHNSINVTDLGDVTGAGSGIIISTAERNALHARSHALNSGSDHSGDLGYSQVDAIVDISGTGANNLLSRADHVHTDGDGSSKVTYSNLSGIPSVFTPSTHDIITKHSDSGLTIGRVIRASGATTFAWAQLAHSDLNDDETAQHFLQSAITTVGTLSAGDVRARDSIGQIASKASGDIFYWTSSLQRLGKGNNTDVLTLVSDVPAWVPAGAPGEHDIITTHSDDGLTIGHVIRATGATSFAWGTLPSHSHSYIPTFPSADRVLIARIPLGHEATNGSCSFNVTATSWTHYGNIFAMGKDLNWWTDLNMPNIAGYSYKATFSCRANYQASNTVYVRLWNRSGAGAVGGSDLSMSTGQTAAGFGQANHAESGYITTGTFHLATALHLGYNYSAYNSAGSKTVHIYDTFLNVYLVKD